MLAQAQQTLKSLESLQLLGNAAIKEWFTHDFPPSANQIRVKKPDINPPHKSILTKALIDQLSNKQLRKWNNRHPRK
jgi:hypothetical protein